MREAYMGEAVPFSEACLAPPNASAHAGALAGSRSDDSRRSPKDPSQYNPCPWHLAAS